MQKTDTPKVQKVKPKKIEEKKPVVKIEPVLPPEPKKSAFEEAVSVLDRITIGNVQLDMEKFDLDFSFKNI